MGLQRYLATAGLAGILAAGSGCALVRQLESYASNFTRAANYNFDSRVNHELRPSDVADAVFYLRGPDADMFLRDSLKYRLDREPEFREGLEKELRSLATRSAGDALEIAVNDIEFVKAIRKWFDVDYQRTDPTRPQDEKFKVDPTGKSVLLPSDKQKIDNLIDYFVKNATDVKFRVRVRDLTEGKAAPEVAFQWAKMYRVSWRPTDDEIRHTLGLSIERTSFGFYFRHDQKLTANDLGFGIAYLINKNQLLSLSAGHNFDEARDLVTRRHDWGEGNSVMLEYFVRF